VLKFGDKLYHHCRICLNGHVVSASLESIESGTKQYCEECGKLTILDCQNCKSPLLGWTYTPRVAIVADFTPPNFCKSCAKPFPWTEAKKNALKELIDFENRLTIKDKKIMEDSIDDIINETPRTKIASMKFKQGLAKAGKETAKIIRDIIVDIASETSRKIILGAD
jgi:hypothetical protein